MCRNSNQFSSYSLSFLAFTGIVQPHVNEQQVHDYREKSYLLIAYIYWWTPNNFVIVYLWMQKSDFLLIFKFYRLLAKEALCISLLLWYLQHRSAQVSHFSFFLFSHSNTFTTNPTQTLGMKQKCEFEVAWPFPADWSLNLLLFHLFVTLSCFCHLFNLDLWALLNSLLFWEAGWTM